MKVSIAQISVKTGDIEGNTNTMLSYVIKAKESGSDIVVFPEMSDTGIVIIPKLSTTGSDSPLAIQNAQTWDKGPVAALKKTAAQNKISIVAGVSEQTPEGVYNSTVIIDRKGETVGAYRKTHLCTFDPFFEQDFFKAGDKLEISHLENIPCGLLTCYDIRFPEIARTLTVKGAKILFITSAFPMIRLQHWEILLAARAIENQVFIVASNQVGSDAGVTFCGTSRIIDPYGTVVCSGSAIHEGLVSGEIDLNMIDTIRSQYKVHQDRRPSLYLLSV